MPFSLTGTSTDDIVHFLLVAVSLALVLISVNVFRHLRSSRYLFLLLAFMFFGLDQVITLWQQIYLNGLLLSLPLVGIHVTHFLELAMAASFVAALLNPVSLRGMQEDE